MYNNIKIYNLKINRSSIIDYEYLFKYYIYVFDEKLNISIIK